MVIVSPLSRVLGPLPNGLKTPTLIIRKSSKLHWKFECCKKLYFRLALMCRLINSFFKWNNLVVLFKPYFSGGMWDVSLLSSEFDALNTSDLMKQFLKGFESKKRRPVAIDWWFFQQKMLTIQGSEMHGIGIFIRIVFINITLWIQPTWLQDPLILNGECILTEGPMTCGCQN